MPASEALLDADSIKRFRSRYREKFGATATQDPLYQALSEGRRMAGMEHWLPLLEERLETLFDHLGEHDLIVRDSARRPGARQPPRGDRGLLPEPRPRDGGRARQLSAARTAARSISRRTNGRPSRADRPIHLASPFPEPESDRVIDFGVAARARLRARARAAGEHLRSRRQACRASCAGAATRSCSRATRAARASGSRGLLEDHGLKSHQAGRQLAGSARRQDPAGAARPAARPRLHHARRRGPHRAGHARRPARPPPQEAQGGRRLPRRAGDALARRPRRPRRPRHRPLRGPDPDPGQQGPARLRRARICARRQALRPGREYRAAEPLRQRERGRQRSTASAARPGSGASRG